MDWLLIATSVTAAVTPVARCVRAKIRAESRRRALEVTLRGASPRERVAILRALRGWAGSE